MKKSLSLLTMIAAFVCLFAFRSSASIVSEAKPIVLNSPVNYSFDDDNHEAVYKFTPGETGYYELTVENFVEDNTYIYIYDRGGNEIAFESDDEFSGECYCAEQLTSGETYYYVIYCYSYDKTTQSKITVSRHSHDLQTSFVNNAGINYDGYYTQECKRCHYETDITVPKAVVTLSNTTFTYNGKTQRPAVTVKDGNGNTFVNGTDYTITYPSRSVDAGYYELKVTLNKANYNDYQIYSYTIGQKSIEKMTASLSKTSYAYDGKYKKPSAKISGLKSGTDFKCYYYGNLYVGVATVLIEGTGNYTGEINKTFKIVPAKIKGFKAVKTTGSSVDLVWSSHCAYQGAQIYDVNAKKIVADVDVLNEKCTVKKLKAGTVYKYKIREWYETDSGVKLYGDWSDTIEFATKPAAAAVKTVKSSKSKTLTATWNKQTSATGYQLQYSTSSKFASKATKTTTVSKNSQTSTSIAKLTGGKKYYVRIRTYKTVKINGKSTKVYSDWSKSKSVTIKK